MWGMMQYCLSFPAEAFKTGAALQVPEGFSDHVQKIMWFRSGQLAFRVQLQQPIMLLEAMIVQALQDSFFEFERLLLSTLCSPCQ